MTPGTKHSFRQIFLTRRQKISETTRSKAEQAVLQTAIKYVKPKPGQVVSGYYPIRGELNPLPILSHFLDQGHVCALPTVVGADEPLFFKTWDRATKMTEGAFGIKIPQDKRSAPILPDIMFVPLCAFRPDGHRLGYGGGFYDRTLAHLKKVKNVIAIGLAFDVQRLDDFMVEPHDEPLDMIITEQDIYTA